MKGTANAGSTGLLEAANRYLAQGWTPIPVPAGEKAPMRKGWQNVRPAASELPRLFNGHGNIGLLLSAPSQGLVDVDLDSAEALQVAEENGRWVAQCVVDV